VGEGPSFQPVCYSGEVHLFYWPGCASDVGWYKVSGERFFLGGSDVPDGIVGVLGHIEFGT
jgi:hypothetical protein